MHKFTFNKIINRSVFIALLLCITFPVFGQSDTLEAQKAKLRNDVRPMDFRIPDKSRIEEFQKDKRFDYFEEKNTKSGVTLLERIIKWLDKLLASRDHKDIENAKYTMSSWWDVVFWGVILLLAMLIVYLVLRYMKVDPRTLFGKKKLDTPGINIYTEDVNEMNFDALIQNALLNKDYRLAVRFLYLKNLKELSDHSIIKWKINKTNYSYLNEISNSNLRSKFLDITLIFDYVWYGEFSLDENQYMLVKDRMEQFNKMIGK